MPNDGLSIPNDTNTCLLAFLFVQHLPFAFVELLLEGLLVAHSQLPLALDIHVAPLVHCSFIILNPFLNMPLDNTCNIVLECGPPAEQVAVATGNNAQLS